jgi:uncharacterized hydrophobic protein (TIGR00341 family)
MRLVELLVLSADAREEIVNLFEERELDYAVTDDASNPEAAATIQLPVPAHAVESVQKQLDDLGVGSEMYTIVVNTEAVVSDRFDRSAVADSGIEALGRERVSRNELHSKAADLLPDFVIYALMTAISAVVATAGVLLDSMPVMVGAMVIAPLIGPSMATSASTVIYDEDLFVKSAKYQALGIGVALLSAFVFALFVKVVAVPNSAINIEQSLQTSNHTSPTFLLVAVAFCAGIAGAVSLSTSGLTTLVGVMISAAIMPPIGVIGVAVSWTAPAVVLGSSAVVLVNVFSINISAIVCLWYFGYHPADWKDLRETRSRMLKRVLVLVALTVALAAFLANLDGNSLQPLIDTYL